MIFALRAIPLVVTSQELLLTERYETILKCDDFVVAALTDDFLLRSKLLEIDLSYL